MKYSGKISFQTDTSNVLVDAKALETKEALTISFKDLEGDSIIKIKEKCVSIFRKTKELKSDITFEKDKHGYMAYDTIYGSMTIPLYTKDVVVERKEGCVLIDVKYTISYDNKETINSFMKVEFKKNEE